MMWCQEMEVYCLRAQQTVWAEVVLGPVAEVAEARLVEREQHLKLEAGERSLKPRELLR